MARDLFHNIVKESLQTQGWTVTHDPFPIDYGDVQMQINLGAEHLIAAERETKKLQLKSKVLQNHQPYQNFTQQLDNISITAML